MSALHAYGGAPLAGNKLVRFAHLDEAVTSAREPYAIVAGVVSIPDKQWRAMQQYLSDLADALVPADIRPGVVLHAKELWHGTGAFHRDKISRERRNRILTEIAKMPAKFDIPVIVNGIDKGVVGETENRKELIYSLAFASAVIGVDHFMREFCDADEMAMLIAEDVPEMRRHAKWGYQRLTEPDRWPVFERSLLPVTRIAENPHFAAKGDSSILQLADTIAFVSCRKLTGKDDVQFLLDEFRENVVCWPGWATYVPRPRPEVKLYGPR